MGAQVAEHLHDVHWGADRVGLAVVAGDRHVHLDVPAGGTVFGADLAPVRWCRPQQRPADAPDQLLLIFP
ncbi:hypothetical protein [Actinocrispum wychmicini]|uniref:hypothetical protein n=1 Tax=Actinocrispum wychmicini TaxID=1213861 RepID=UPI001042F897|nr:hypothetical protein [Actinocrispum wychmicini]